MVVLPRLQHNNSVKCAAPSRDWLEALPEELRNRAAQFAHRAARAGAAEPIAVVVGLALAVGEHRAWGNPDRERLQPVADALLSDTAGALAYAGWVLAWEALPEAERQRLKAAKAVGYQREYMAGQPPTEKQLSYLFSLGYRGERPGSKASASTLIDEWLQR